MAKFSARERLIAAAIKRGIKQQEDKFSDSKKLYSIFLESIESSELSNEASSQGFYLQAYDHAKTALTKMKKLKNISNQDMGYMIASYIDKYKHEDITPELCESSFSNRKLRGIDLNRDVLYAI